MSALVVVHAEPVLCALQEADKLGVRPRWEWKRQFCTGQVGRRVGVAGEEHAFNKGHEESHPSRDASRRQDQNICSWVHDLKSWVREIHHASILVLDSFPSRRLQTWSQNLFFRMRSSVRNFTTAMPSLRIYVSIT